MLLVRKTIRAGVKVVSTSDPEILGVKMDRNFFGLKEDIHIWFTYAPPITSPYARSRKNVLDCLEKTLFSYQNNIVMGDLNGRTSIEKDFIEEKYDEHSPVNDIVGYDFDTPVKRNNSDTSPVDTHGRRVLDICQTISLRILNGRTRGDRWGNLTRFPLKANERPSTIDYALCSNSLLEDVVSFFVLPLNQLSDHCCISLSIKTLRAKDDPIQKEEVTPQISTRFDIDFVDLYKENLERDIGFSELSKVIEETQDYTQGSIDEWTTQFNNLVLNNARVSFPTKNTKKPQKRVTKTTKWYTEECNKAKQQLRRTLNKMRKRPYDRNLQDRYLAHRKEYKKVCRRAEATLRASMVEKLLNENDPKSFWKMIDKMKGWGREETDPSICIPRERWIEHYKKLLNGPEPENLSAHYTAGPKFSPITDKELEEAIDTSKKGKACGPDQTYIEYIKYAPDNVISTLLKLINTIYMCAIYPKPWTVNYLRPIHKKDAKDDPENYRGLAIGPALSKLFSLILLQRLDTFTEDKKLISVAQIAFRRGYRTADHVFLLKTLITKALRRKKKLYAAFIDFRKAYDTVNRSKLLKTLEDLNIDKQLLANISALYREVNYTIKLGANTLEPIPSNLGLKQGCPLSPILFNLYINDISKYLNKKPEESLSIQGTLVNHFLYADDLVILSETREGLQDQLERLHKFADDKDLTVNTKKSMIMIFNKSGRLMKEKLTYGGKELTVVPSFTYLGIDITSSGSFALGTKELNNKARKAMFSLYKTIMQFQLPYSETIRLFNTFIEPILLYNAENLSILSEKEIEKCKTDYHHIFRTADKVSTTTTQLKFLKFALGLHKQSSNMATFGETSELPIILKGYVRMLCFWKRTTSLGDETLVKKAYQENIHLNTTWCKTIQVLNASLGLNNITIEEKDFKKVTKDIIKNKFIEVWKSNIGNPGGKLNFYAMNKHDFQVEPYLKSTLHFKDRRRISRLLCSDHVPVTWGNFGHWDNF